MDLCALTPVTSGNSTEEPCALFGLDFNQFDLPNTSFDGSMEAAGRRSNSFHSTFGLPNPKMSEAVLRAEDSGFPEAHFYPLSAEFWSHLHSLSSLLRLRQQLDDDGPAVLHRVLQVNKGVAHVEAHAALPADRR